MSKGKMFKKIINSIITCPVTDVVHTELQATGEHIRTRKLQGTYTRNEENPEEGRWSYLKDTEPQDKKAPPDPPAWKSDAEPTIGALKHAQIIQ